MNRNNWLLLAGCIAALIIVTILNPTTSTSTTEKWTVHIGQHGTLNSGAEYSPVLNSEAAFKQWLNAEIAGDKAGKVALAATGDALLVPSGAEVLVLDYGHASVPGAVVAITKVRVLNGPNGGSAGWVAASHVH